MFVNVSAIALRRFMERQDRHREPTRPLQPLTVAFLPDFNQGNNGSTSGVSYGEHFTEIFGIGRG